MLNDHPDAERLSALAAHETDATHDASLTAHVSSCEQCGELVRDLGVVRAALAELPDLVPSRPLRLLPAVEPEAGGIDRLGAWARRLFAPALTAGAALAMVGLVGTAFPSMAGMGAGAQGGADEGADLQREMSQPDTLAGAQGAGEGTAESTAVAAEEAEAPGDAATGDGSELRFDDTGSAPVTLTKERSPWPMVLFSGLALMIAAALLRWIVVPRAG